MINPEDILEPEWVYWYSLTAQERFAEFAEMWKVYIAYGGSLDPDPDTQSPFFDQEEWSALHAHGRPGVYPIRRR